MTILDEIQAGIAQRAESTGSSVVGIGQRWGAGSGIVIGAGRVLTNAHNVRGDQVTVTFADGRTVEGSVAGHDIDGDLAVIEVDTGGAPAPAWAGGGGGAGVGRRRGRGDRDAGVRPVHPRRARAARDVRVRLRRGPGVPGTARPPYHRQPRAYRDPAARLLPRPRPPRWGD